MAGEQDLTTAAMTAATPAAVRPVSVPLVPGTLAQGSTLTASEPTIADTGRSEARVKPAADLAPYAAMSHWRPWPAFGVVVAIVVVAVAVALGGGVVVLAMSPTPSGPPRSAKIMLAMLAAQLIMIGGTLIAARSKGDRLATALALRPPIGGLRSYAGALVVMLGAVAAYTAFTSFAFAHDPGEDLGEMIEVFRGPWWPLALTVIGAGAPLSEELMFRGFLQTVLVRTRFGYWGASLITTAIWTSLHAGYSLIGLGEVFMIGLIFALFLRRTGSLRVTLLCHAVYNSSIALLMIFAPKELFGI